MLDLRVDLFYPTTTTNDSGQVVKTWAQAGSYYAQRIVNENTGSESMQYDQMVSSTVMLWRLRYPLPVLVWNELEQEWQVMNYDWTDVQKHAGTWKLEYDGQSYDVLSVSPEGRRRYLIFKTRLRDNGTTR